MEYNVKSLTSVCKELTNSISSVSSFTDLCGLVKSISFKYI